MSISTESLEKPRCHNPTTRMSTKSRQELFCVIVLQFSFVYRNIKQRVLHKSGIRGSHIYISLSSCRRPETTNNSHFSFEAQASHLSESLCRRLGAKCGFLAFCPLTVSAPRLAQCKYGENTDRVTLPRLMRPFAWMTFWYILCFLLGPILQRPSAGVRVTRGPGSGGRGTRHRRGPAEVRTRGSVRTHQPAAAHAATSRYPAAARNIYRFPCTLFCF